MKLLTVKEVASALRCNVNTVYNLVNNAELETVRVGKLIRIPEDVLEKFINDQLGRGASDGDK